MNNRPAQNIASTTGRFLVCLVFITALSLGIIQRVQAVDYPKLSNRSLNISDTTPGATNLTYTIRFSYPSPTTIGSIRLQLCTDGEIGGTCTSTGGSLAAAALSSQTGITGFSINSQSADEILLTRAPGAAGTGQSTYEFTGIDNPTGFPDTFFIRIQTYPTGDGSGVVNHASSVVSATTEPIIITTEVPPILYFCAALTLDEWCQNSVGNQINYGALSPATASASTSQFGVATNALGGYVVTINGNTMTSGFKTIDPIAVPTINLPGTAQFGLNLRANTDPAVGQDVIGTGIGTVAAAYDTPDTFQYTSGDTVATSVTGSLFNIFTVTYIVNVPPDQAAGVYSTTIAYICTAAF